MSSDLSRLEAQLSAAKRRLASHRVHELLHTAEGLRTFLEHHVICVLDFVSLVKRLQQELTCVELPWTRPAEPRLARWMNEIVLDEESDEAFGERPASHYEWYLAAMDEVGADSAPIREVEARLRRGLAPDIALSASRLPRAAIAFGRLSYAFVRAPLPVVAAAFCHGREMVIPSIFLPLVRTLEESGVPCLLFRRYLERHIEVDGSKHGPLAERLLDHACGNQPERRERALRTGLQAVEARLALWDAILETARPKAVAAAAFRPSSSLP